MRGDLDLRRFGTDLTRPPVDDPADGPLLLELLAIGRLEG